MFERFTDEARQAVVAAQTEARLLDHDYIGTEHLLLGVAAEPDSIAARVLSSLGVSLDALRADVEAVVGRGPGIPSEQIPFTTGAKRALELSLREALVLGHDHIGTHHVLLGLMREGEGAAAEVLRRHGVDFDAARLQTVQLLSEGAAEQRSPAESVLTSRMATVTAAATAEQLSGDEPRCPRCNHKVAGDLRSRAVRAADADDASGPEVVVVWCGRCGAVLGVTAPGRKG